MTLKGYRSRSQLLDSKYLENGGLAPGRTFMETAMVFECHRQIWPGMNLRGQKSRSHFSTWNMSRTATVTMLDPTENTQSAHGLYFTWPWKVKGKGHNPLIRNIFKTVTYDVWPWMTFRGQKSRSNFYAKYVENGKNYDIGPMGFTLDDLKRLKVKVTNGPLTAIGMWEYTPVRITGVLDFVSFFFCCSITWWWIKLLKNFN